MQHTLLRTASAGLAAAAVLGMGATAPAAAVACGQPAAPAVYTTVVHPAVTETVPAQTHQEWLWSRTVTTTHRQATRTTAGYDVRSWSRTTEQREHEYSEKVVDQAFVPATPGTPEVGHWITEVVTPAVTMTLWEYLQVRTGNTRWEEEGWNAGDQGRGWIATGDTDLVVVEPAMTRQAWIVDAPAVPGTPAVPEISHLVQHWLPEGAAAPSGLVATGASRVASSSTETVELRDGESPAGTGWVVGAVVDSVAPVVETLWLDEGETAPAGFTETGVQQQESTTETTSARSAAAPAGAGWSPVDGSALTVEDRPAETVVVIPELVEQVLVVPGAPAGPACVSGPVAPPLVNPVSAESDAPSAVVAAPAAQAAAVLPAAVLPATGSDVPAWVPLLGLGSLISGLVLVRRGRRETPTG